MGFLFRYGLWVAALAIIVGYLIRFLREARRDPVTGRYRIDPTSFGPLSSYIERRGGLTQREVWGLCLVLALMIAAFLFTLVSGTGQR
jgi:hypothetical protein